jgi:hypothetical protein
MIEPVQVEGLNYEPLFKTSRLGEEQSVYYLHRETGMCFRQGKDSSARCVVLGMFPSGEIRIVGGFNIIKYLNDHHGEFPFFVPKFGPGLKETFDYRWPIFELEKNKWKDSAMPSGFSLDSMLNVPCCLRFYDDRSFNMKDVVESLEKGKINLKPNVSNDLMFFYGSSVVEVYGEYNPLDYL